jgi:hypothetical protein
MSKGTMGCLIVGFFILFIFLVTFGQLLSFVIPGLAPVFLGPMVK